MNKSIDYQRSLSAPLIAGIPRIASSLSRGAALALALAWPCGFASAAENFPDRPIKIVIPFAPGGTAEPIARLLVDGMAKRNGATVVINTRPGAAGILGTSEVARSDPDGYTLLLGSVTQFVVNQFLVRSSTIRSERDFEPISILADQCQVVYVPANFPAKTMTELLDHIKARPGEINYASPGVGTGPHLSGELLSQLYGLKMVHIPFSGGAAAINAMLSGDVHLFTTALSVGKGQVDAGKLRVLAVTSPNRMASLPEVPTTAEAGTPQFTTCTWWALAAPKGIPPAVLTWLHREITAVVRDPAIAARLEDFGFIALGTTPGEFKDRMAREAPVYQKLIEERKLARD